MKSVLFSAESNYYPASRMNHRESNRTSLPSLPNIQTGEGGLEYIGPLYEGQGILMPKRFNSFIMGPQDVYKDVSDSISALKNSINEYKDDISIKLKPELQTPRLRNH